MLIVENGLSGRCKTKRLRERCSAGQCGGRRADDHECKKQLQKGQNQVDKEEGKEGEELQDLRLTDRLVQEQEEEEGEGEGK